MKVQKFELVVPEGRELASQHVIMQHGQQYRIQVSNHSYVRCDAVVSLDGDEIGTYRLSAGQVWAIEHPADSQQRFTFYASGTSEAAAVGEAVLNKDEKGLVQVTFYPEKSYGDDYVLETLGSTRGGLFGATRGGKGLGLGAGVSGLSGHSDAQYGRASSIERDEDNAVTITLRLVTEDTTPQPISLRRRIANPIPRAV
ncbi:MAG: hypothetical protein ACK59C_01195 [Holosporales bacterium]|jgi:hypothetical protein